MLKNFVVVGFIVTCVALAFPVERLSGAEPSTEKTKWLSDPTSNVRIWNPAPMAEESVRWLGASDSASGPGVAIWSVQGVEQERASGEWKKGKLNGFAVWQHRNGARYEGCWDAGRRNGSGVYIWPDETRFCGQYQAGARLEGAVFNREGTPLDGPPTAAISKLVFEAEAAALSARKAATAARQRPARGDLRQAIKLYLLDLGFQMQ